MNRIICIGNRYIAQDAAGPAVYDYLQGQELPPQVEVIDGGVGGLALLRFMENVYRVIFVDQTCGFTETMVVMRGVDVADLAERYDHAAGLPYLLRIFPQVCEGMLPEIAVIGIGPDPAPILIRTAARQALQMATDMEMGG